MSQMRVVEKAERSPSCCAVCGGNNAPFVDLQLISFRVNTPVGVQEIEGTVYLCVGTPENPGCAVQVGRLSGQLADVSTVAEMQEQLDSLEAQLAKMTTTLKTKTIKLGELEEIGITITAASGVTLS